MLNFIIKYAEYISWAITVFMAVIILLIFIFVGDSIEFSNAMAITGLGLIMLFIADGSGGTREWPWRVDIHKMLQNEIAKQEDIGQLGRKNIISIALCFLYKAYANSAILGLMLLCIGLIGNK